MAKLNTPSFTFEKYDGKIIIDFYEKYGRYSHIYIRRDNGEWLKSVTKATGILDKPALIPWACKVMAEKLVALATEKGKLIISDIEASKTAWRDKRDDSADKGKQIHALVSEYIKFKLGINKKAPALPKEPKDDHPIANAYLAFRDWEIQHKVKFLKTEFLVYSKKYNFVGTLDCIAEVDGEYCLIDFKSGNGIYWDMILQVSGYGIAHEEELGKKFDRCWIVRFGKDTAEFQAKDFTISEKLNKAFLSCHYLSSIQKEVEEIVK